MTFVRAAIAAGLLVGAVDAAFAFELQALDPGSEVPVLDGAPGPRSVAAQRSLPLLRGGTIGGKLAVQGMYERRGERVYFETRRGQLASDASVAATHPYEIDVCFRDADGLPLFAVVAGDEPLIADCAPESVTAQLAERPDLLTGFNRPHDAMKRATRIIEKAAFAPAFAAEKGELVHPARQASRRIGKRRPMERVLKDVKGDDAVPPPAEEPTPIEDPASLESPADSASATAALSPRAGVWWKHILGVWTGRAFNVTPFEHTATIAYTAYSFNRVHSYALFSWQNRNHGRYWYEAGMRHKCTYHSAFNRGPSIWRQTCATSYNPTSIWGHNCNDDAVMQIWSVKYNRPYNNVSGYPCNEPRTNLFSPACLPNG